MYKVIDVNNKGHANIRIWAFACEWHQPPGPQFISDTYFSLYFCGTTPSGQFVVGDTFWVPKCIPAGSKNFQDRPRLTGISATEKMSWNTIWLLLCISLWVCSPSQQSQPQGKWLLKNELQASVLKQRMTLITQNAGKAIFLRERKGINKEYVFSPLSNKNCLTSKTWELQACPDYLTYRVRAVCLPALSKHCKHIPRLYCDYPWGSRL